MEKFKKVMSHLPLWGESTSPSCDMFQDDSPNQRISPPGTGRHGGRLWLPPKYPRLAV